MGGLGDMLVAQTGLFLRRVGPARFERRPTIRKLRDLLVGRRGEAPLVPPYILPSFKIALDLHET